MGLFKGFGHTLSNADINGGLHDARGDEIADLASKLCIFAEQFGKNIRTQDRPNNQFALYNALSEEKVGDVMR